MTSRAATLLAYGAVLAAAVAVEVASRIPSISRRGYAPFVAVLGHIRSRSTGRLALLVGWAWLVWHLLAR